MLRSKKPSLRLLPPLYQWQTWPEYYEPSDDEIISMGDDEYHAYMVYFTKKAKENHPTNRKPQFFDQDA